MKLITWILGAGVLLSSSKLLADEKLMFVGEFKLPKVTRSINDDSYGRYAEYLDVASITDEDDNTVRGYWEMDIRIDHRSANVTHLRSHTSMNCMDRTYFMDEVLLYDKNSDVVKKITFNREWNHITPGTIGDFEYGLICK